MLMKTHTRMSSLALPAGGDIVPRGLNPSHRPRHHRDGVQCHRRRSGLAFTNPNG